MVQNVVKPRENQVQQGLLAILDCHVSKYELARSQRLQ